MDSSLNIKVISTIEHCRPLQFGTDHILIIKSWNLASDYVGSVFLTLLAIYELRKTKHTSNLLILT